MSESLRLLFINGIPSSGKDTQADLLLEKYPNNIKISTGDIFRGAQTPDGYYGRFYPYFRPFIERGNSGGLVPDTVMVGVVDKLILEERDRGVYGFIFTGFPRTLGQLEAVDNWIAALKQGLEVRAKFLWFEVSDEIARIRTKKRRESSLKRGEPPREDDKEEVLERRIRTFKENTIPMYQQLLLENRVLTISAEASKKRVHKEVIKSGIMK